METLQRTANRGSISTGYDIDNSLKLESDNSERLYKTPGGAGNRRTFTISFWTKRTEINGVKQYPFEAGNSDSDTDRFTLRFGIGDTFDIQSQSTWLSTNRVFRDTSAWYHFVIKVDTTDGTAANRIKLYVNGVEETSFATDNRASLNQNNDFPVNNTEIHNIGSSPVEGGLYYNGYIAEWVQIDGTASAPTAFGEVDEDSGIWKPIDVSGLTFGTNGFYLDFEASGDLGNDANGGTDFTLSNITSADQATDTPTNNFCTINPLIPYNGSVTEGATKFLHTAGGDGWESFVATMGAGTSGKWYAEFKFVDTDFTNMIGICPIDDPDLNRGGASFAYYGSDTSLDESVGYYSSDGNRYIGGGPSSYGNSYARTNIMSIAVDMDNGKLYFAKDGVWQNSGDPTSGATGTGALDVRGATKPQSLGASNYYSGEDILANYGGYTTISISTPATDANGYGTFEYAPPTGYYALCTKNLAEFG
jgi:hypothetical protein